MPDFHVGQLVHHRRYGYRGVIIKVDDGCQAPMDWYMKNRTQPRRDQPWYHVLVDGGAETYVAQTSIEPDESGEMVDHPLVKQLFSMFLGGEYHRTCPN